MEFRHVESTRRFEALEDGQVAGWIDCQRRGSAVAMVHTRVPDQFGGRGVGQGLAAYALGYARENGWPVLPDCPFIRHYIVGHPEFVALVPAGQRAEFDL